MVGKVENQEYQNPTSTQDKLLTMKYKAWKQDPSLYKIQTHARNHMKETLEIKGNTQICLYTNKGDLMELITRKWVIQTRQKYNYCGVGTEARKKAVNRKSPYTKEGIRIN